MIDFSNMRDVTMNFYPFFFVTRRETLCAVSGALLQLAERLVEIRVEVRQLADELAPTRRLQLVPDEARRRLQPVDERALAIRLRLGCA